MRGIRDILPESEELISRDSKYETVKKVKEKFKISENYAKSLGYPNKMKDPLSAKVKDYEHFKYIENTNDKDYNGDVMDFNELIEAFYNLGFSFSEVDAIMKITAACLHCG